MIARFSLFSYLPLHPFLSPPGEAEWRRRRTAWTARSKNEQSSEDALHMLDVEQVIVCLHGYRPFAQPVQLASMVEILCVLWEEDGY